MRLSKRRLAQDLRVLSCLGGSGPAAAQALVERLRAGCAFDAAGILWSDRNGVNDAYFHESPEVYALMPHYAGEFCGRREREVMVGFDEACGIAPGPRHLREILRVSPAQYFRHDLYGEIMRPAGLHHTLRLTLSDGENFIGLMLGRHEHHADFDSEHLQQLEGLAAYVAAILLPRKPASNPEADSGDSAVVVSDHRARLRRASPLAQAMVRQLFGPRCRFAPERNLPPELAALVGRARMLLKVGEGAEPPIWERRNRWGRFRVQAYVLDLESQGCDGDYALHIRRFVPLALRLHGVLQSLDLSPRQAQVGALLLRSLPERQIADLLGVAPSTVIQHRRQLYCRLDVDSRAAFRERLMRMA